MSFCRIPGFRFAVVLLPVLLAGVWTLPARALDSTRLAAHLQQLQEDARAPGATAAVMVDGALVWSGGVGMADVENAVPMRSDAVHNIGSISKVFGAIAVMQLVERGKVDLDAEIQTYAPWFPRKPWPISVRQILTHTSGIRHYRDGEFGEGDALSFVQYGGIEAATRFWRDEPLLFAPGTHWRYSSHASNLLQAVVEAASGQDLESYLREHVWQPAGMASTTLDVPTRIVPRRARGYRLDAGSGKLSNAVQENMSYKYVGGGILADDVDLVRLGHALNRGHLLGDAALAEMYRPQLDPGVTAYAAADESPGRAPVQALVWRVQQDAAGNTCYAHSGSVKGTLSYLLNCPRQDVVVALHVNAWGGQARLQDTAEALAAEVLAMTVPSPSRR